MIEVNNNNNNNNNNNSNENTNDNNNNINYNSNDSDSTINNNENTNNITETNNKSQLKRKVEEFENNNNNGIINVNSNENNNSNEFELKEFNIISKKFVAYRENDSNDDDNNNNHDKNNSNGVMIIDKPQIQQNNEEEFSFDYTYSYNMNNNFMNRDTTETIDLCNSDDDEDGDNKTTTTTTSSTGLNTPIQGLSFGSPLMKQRQQQLSGSPMSISWNSASLPRQTPTLPISIPNSNKSNNNFNINSNNSINNSINNNNSLQVSVGGTTAEAMKTLELGSSTNNILNDNNTISSPISLLSTSITKDKNNNNNLINPNPYEIDPVLKEQYLIEEMKLEKEKKEAEALNTLPEYDHLIFIIHGIGSQVSENRVQTLEQNVTLLKKNCDTFQKDSTKKLNVDFQIIEWHSKLRNDNLTDNLEKISPVGVKKIRDFINETLLDILLYMSPLYHQEILNEVSNQINTAYHLFKEKNKYFKGSVSIFAHSLGSVITWDILSKGLIDFKVENVFSFGSPLGMFLTIQNIPLGSLEMKKVLPTCENWFNIFSPTDAVAYRIEPFFKNYTKYLEYDPCLIEIEVDKKPLKQKLSGLFFKSSTVISTSPNKNDTNTITTTTTSITKSSSSNSGTSIEKFEKTTEKIEKKQEKEIIDVEGDEFSGGNISRGNSGDDNTPKESKRRFKVHPLEPDSPTLFNNENDFDDFKKEDTSLKSKFLSKLSNVQKSMSSSMNKSTIVNNKNDQQPLPSPSNNNNNNNNNNSPSSNNTAAAAAVVKQMIKESIMLSISSEPDVGFDREDKRFDFNVDDGGSTWTSGLPGATYIASMYSHIGYWISKPCALFITKKLIHTSSKISKPSSPTITDTTTNNQ